VSERGEPVLIDPAAYAGHREIDLAMMRLFGGFGARVFDAYAESFPLSPGHEERVALYQLYPLLVHLCSFGAGYLGQVKSCLSRYV
jgi:fructosamine-3-kinase